MKIWFSHCKLWQLHVVEILFMLFDWMNRVNGTETHTNTNTQTDSGVYVIQAITAIVVYFCNVAFDPDSIFLAKLQFAISLRALYVFLRFAFSWKYKFSWTEKCSENGKKELAQIKKMEWDEERRKGEKNEELTTEWLKKRQPHIHIHTQTRKHSHTDKRRTYKPV